jgi:hypothetical protein
MAKYSRFDPKNKKRDRNKSRSLNKDLRIREEGKNVITKKELMEFALDELERENVADAAKELADIIEAESFEDKFWRDDFDPFFYDESPEEDDDFYGDDQFQEYDALELEDFKSDDT